MLHLPPASNFQGALDEKLASIEGKYKVDDNGVIIQKIIDSQGNKDDIYVKLLEFLTRTYNDANEVIQVKEKEEGVIVCKGCYKFKVTDFLLGSSIEETAWHIYKAEIKDGKARVTITLDQMDFYSPPAGNLSAESGSYSILDCPPVKSYQNQSFHVRKGHVFYYAVSNLINLMEATEKALSQDSSYKVDDNW